jgi:DNA ligase (NAD+)
MTNNEIATKLAEADQAYYNTGNHVLSDIEYDSLRELLRKGDSNHPYFEKVGEKPSSAWQKAQHEIPMGSLEKIYFEEEFLKWAAKTGAETFIAQPKVDGLSLGQKYDAGTFNCAITRGDGEFGELISPNVERMSGFVKEPNVLLAMESWGNSFSVRCEIVLLKENLERINSISEEPYKNCRNAASGISRRLDGKFSKYLSLLYYDILGEDPLDEDKKVELLNSLGFHVVPSRIGTAKEVVEFYNQFKKDREDIPYGIDGVVIKVLSWEKQLELGTINNRPKGQIAWKFDAAGAATTLKNITWETGRTGVICPLGHVEKVEIEGSEIERVTLHNVAQIRKNNLGLGDLVLIEKAGDVIPYLSSVIEHKGNPIEIPTKCPSCNSNLVNDEIKLMCTNDLCEAKIFQRILYFIKTLKIDSFGESLAEKLYDLGKLKTLADLFKITKEDIASIEGWGSKSAETIIANIHKVKKIDPITFLSSMGIPSLSTSTAEDLWKKYGSMDKIKAATLDDICTIKGYSFISAKKIVDGLAIWGGQIEAVLKFVEFQDNATDGKFSGMRFCFTGAMAESRSFYQAIVTKNGGKNDSSITKATTYLVCNENKGSSKSRKAEKVGCKIINEAQFMELAGEVIQQKPKLVTKSLFEE